MIRIGGFVWVPTSVQRGNVLDVVAPISGLAIPLLEGGGRIDGPVPQVGDPHGDWEDVPVWRWKI